MGHMDVRNLISVFHDLVVQVALENSSFLVVSYCADLSSWRTCCQRIRLPVHCLPRGFWIWRRHCLL